jgi:hypothetical protein
MFDVDPRRRMTIEEVCAHPWLQSHQARGPAVPPPSVETEEQRATYMAEMSRRFHTHIESKCVLNLFVLNTGLLGVLFYRGCFGFHAGSGLPLSCGNHAVVRDQTQILLARRVGTLFNVALFIPAMTRLTRSICAPLCVCVCVCVCVCACVCVCVCARYPRRRDYRTTAGSVTIDTLADAATRYAADRPFASAVCEGVVEVFRRPSGHDASQAGGVLDFPVFKAWHDDDRNAVCFEWVTNVPVTLPR